MKREHLIIHLEASGCKVIKHNHKKGWTAVKNLDNLRIHAVPPGDPLRKNTVVVVCKFLEVEIPQAILSSK